MTAFSVEDFIADNAYVMSFGLYMLELILGLIIFS